MKNGDTQKIKAIKADDIKSGNNGNGGKSGNPPKGPSKKSSGFGRFINVFGLVLLVVMLTYVGVNFARDARVFQKPLLTSETGKAKNAVSEPADNNGTITYKKSTQKSTPATKNNSSGKGNKTPKAKPTPIPTADP